MSHFYRQTRIVSGVSLSLFLCCRTGFGLSCWRYRKSIMARESAGLLMYRLKNGQLEFLLVHPGGPFWKNKQAGAWTIPKGEINVGEDALATAQREFAEELGTRPEGSFIELTPIRQKAGKVVHAWAVKGDFDTASFKSNTFQMEWPPRSGKLQAFPEIDQAAFFPFAQAKEMINPAQVPLLEELKQVAKLS